MMSSTGGDTMMFESFNLFDMEHTGAISLYDIHEVGSSYGINAYQGEAGTTLFKKYAGKNNLIEKGPEFEGLVNDKTTPYVMAILLRAYAKQMSQTAGQVSKAVKRIDVASAVTSYFELVCPRNLTKVSWVAQALTNGSLPEAFTACVLAELAINKDDPNALTTVDIGGMSTGAMVSNNLTAVLLAVDLLSNSDFFTTQGFDISDQPMVLEIVSKWILEGPSLWKKMVQAVGMSGLEVGDSKSGLSVSLQKVFEEMPKTARRLSKAKVKEHKRTKAASKIVKRQSLFKTKAQNTLLLHLTGGRSFSDTVQVESAAEQAVNGGVPAAPVTLAWAKWLAANATSTANELQEYSTDYAKTSSTTTDSFNTQIQGIVNKINSFIGVMESYSTPAGIASLKDTIEKFESGAMSDVMSVVEKTILGFVEKELGTMFGTSTSLLQEGSMTASEAMKMKTAAGSRARARQILVLVKAESERRQAQKG